MNSAVKTSVLNGAINPRLKKIPISQNTRIAINKGDTEADEFSYIFQREIAMSLPNDRALSLGNDIAISRWKIYENSSASVSPLFIAILVFWLMGIFFSLGLIAPFNTLVLTALFMAALSMTGAILLTLELDQPYGGLIQFSTDPLKIALEQFR